MSESPSLVLASASSARARVLEGAGLAHLRDPADIDEDAVKAAHRGDGADTAALALAEAKAVRVAARHRGALVIGADQILDCDGTWFDKPTDAAEATAHLRRLSARTHRLVSAVCVVRDGACLWRHVATARLTMRPLDDAFIARYLELAGPEALESVGAYRIEGPGIRLFAAIDGDVFTILGLPLLPLLDFLRREGWLAG